MTSIQKITEYYYNITMTSIQNNTEYYCNITTIQMGFRRKSNDLFESVSVHITNIVYYHVVVVIYVGNKIVALYSCLPIHLVGGC